MLHGRIDIGRMAGTSALHRDFLSAAAAPIHRWLPAFHAGVFDGPSAGRTAVTGAVVERLVAFNQALGVRDDVLVRLAGLADGRVRAIVTGQQPGVLGGPLMSLYKAATAVALSREIEARTGQPCVPVFWFGCDDDDFAEVRDLSVLSQDLSRLDVTLDAAAYRPGLRVGDIAADAVRSTWALVVGMLPGGGASERLRTLAAESRDFGHAAAEALAFVTEGAVAMIDGRDDALRHASRPLLLDFFDREPALRESIEREGRALAAAGYHAQLPATTDSGLFLVRDGVRHRVPPEQRARARAEFAADITAVSPGVVARNLVQDAVLAPLALVLGPAEIAYRAQLVSVYREMGVAMPVVVPRLSATYLPAPVALMLSELGLDAAAVASDPAEFARSARSAAEDVAFKDAARALEAAFAREARVFAELSGARLDARARERLDRRFKDIAQRLGQALGDAIDQDALGAESRWPFLARFPEMFRRDSVAQERFLSMLVPAAFHGAEAWRAHDALAGEFVRDALDRRVWHGVYSVS